MLEHDTMHNNYCLGLIITRFIVSLAYLIYGSYIIICACYYVVGVTSFWCLLYAVLEVIDH